MLGARSRLFGGLGDSAHPEGWTLRDDDPDQDLMPPLGLEPPCPTTSVDYLRWLRDQPESDRHRVDTSFLLQNPCATATVRPRLRPHRTVWTSAASGLRPLVKIPSCEPVRSRLRDGPYIPAWDPQRLNDDLAPNRLDADVVCYPEREFCLGKGTRQGGGFFDRFPPARSN